MFIYSWDRVGASRASEIVLFYFKVIQITKPGGDEFGLARSEVTDKASCLTHWIRAFPPLTNQSSVSGSERILIGEKIDILELQILTTRGYVTFCE